jgi:hypothetical protein
LHGILETMQPLWGRPIEAIVRNCHEIECDPTGPKSPNDDAVTFCRRALAAPPGDPQLPNNFGKALQPLEHNDAGVALIGLACLPQMLAHWRSGPGTRLQVDAFI